MLDISVTIVVDEVTGEFKGKIDNKVLKIPKMDSPDDFANLVMLIDSLVSQTTDSLCDQLAIKYDVSKAKGSA